MEKEYRKLHQLYEHTRVSGMDIVMENETLRAQYEKLEMKNRKLNVLVGKERLVSLMEYAEKNEDFKKLGEF